MGFVGVIFVLSFFVLLGFFKHCRSIKDSRTVSILASTATAEDNLITDLLLQGIAIIKIAVIILLGFLLPPPGNDT